MLTLALGDAADNNEEIAEEMRGSEVAEGPAAETWLSSEETAVCREAGRLDALDAIDVRAEPAATVSDTGLRVLPTAPARDVTAAETLGATVPEGPAAETWDRSEDRTGWTDTGSSEAWDLIDERMAPAPAALPPAVGTREVAPANKDETAEETLGASVPDEPAAETCDRSDESAGRTELGKFEA